MALRVPVDDVHGHLGLVLQQALEQIHRLPHATRDEVAEERDIGIGHVPHRDATKSPIPDVGLGQHVVLPGVVLGAVDPGLADIAPHVRQVELNEHVDHVRRGGVQLFRGDVLVARQ
jgi:hypothetical protein